MSINMDNITGHSTLAQKYDFDIVFNDILVNSKYRDTNVYKDCNNYRIDLPNVYSNIFKAEIIEVQIPAVTDNFLNIQPEQNRLYLSYLGNKFFITVQAGTYFSPGSLAIELQNRVRAAIELSTIPYTATHGIDILYNQNVNRFLFIDRGLASGNLIIYPKDGYNNGTYTVTNSIGPSIRLEITDTIETTALYTIKDPGNPGGDLVVDQAQPGDYGSFGGTDLPTDKTLDIQFGNTIASEIIHSNFKLRLSLGNKLNGNTIVLPRDYSNTRLLTNFFCQIPINQIGSSSQTTTMLNQPCVYSSSQFYNPLVNKLDHLDIKWYTDTNLVNILDHTFTLRVYSYQKRFNSLSISH